MENGSFVEIEIGTNGKPRQPGKSDIRIEGTWQIGGTQVDELKRLIQNALQSPPEDLTAYIVVQCTKNETATWLAAKFTKYWKEAQEDESSDFLTVIARNIKGETEEESLADVSFTAVENNVNIQIKWASHHVEQVNGMIQMGQMTAATILENNQAIKFEVTHDKTFKDILTSGSSMLLSLASGIRAKIGLTLWSQLMQAISAICEKSGWSILEHLSWRLRDIFGISQAQATLAIAGLYKGGRLALQFRSPDLLPKTLRDKLFPKEGNEGWQQMFREEASPQIKKLTKAFCLAGNGLFSVFLHASKVVANIDGSVQGLSNFFYDESDLNELLEKQEKKSWNVSKESISDETQNYEESPRLAKFLLGLKLEKINIHEFDTVFDKAIKPLETIERLCNAFNPAMAAFEEACCVRSIKDYTIKDALYVMLMCCSATVGGDWKQLNMQVTKQSPFIKIDDTLGNESIARIFQAFETLWEVTTEIARKSVKLIIRLEKVTEESKEFPERATTAAQKASLGQMETEKAENSINSNVAKIGKATSILKELFNADAIGIESQCLRMVSSETELEIINDVGRKAKVASCCRPLEIISILEQSREDKADKEEKKQEKEEKKQTMFWEKDKEDTQTMKTPSQIEETPSQIEEMPSQIEEKTPSQIEKNESQNDELKSEKDKEIELLKKQVEENQAKEANLNRQLGNLQSLLDDKTEGIKLTAQRTNEEINQLKADKSGLTARLEKAKSPEKNTIQSNTTLEQDKLRQQLQSLKESKEKEAHDFELQKAALWKKYEADLLSKTTALHTLQSELDETKVALDKSLTTKSYSFGSPKKTKGSPTKESWTKGIPIKGSPTKGSPFVIDTSPSGTQAAAGIPSQQVISHRPYDWVWSETLKGRNVMISGGKTISTKSNNDAVVMVDVPLTDGQYTWKIQLDKMQDTDFFRIGVADKNLDLNLNVTRKKFWGYNPGNGYKYVEGSRATPWGMQANEGDFIEVELVFANRKGTLSFIVNGQNLGVLCDDLDAPVYPAAVLYYKGKQQMSLVG